MDTRRRQFLTLFSSALLGGTAIALMPGLRKGLIGSAASADEVFEIVKTDAEWQKILSPEAFAVMRQQDTEHPGTSELLHEERKGTFGCAACDLPLYDAAMKFDSGTGWPSFFDHLPDAVGTTTDHFLGYGRTEVHCHRCGGHLGHVFEDGPQPTGLRYCMNGVSLQFHPKDGAA